MKDISIILLCTIFLLACEQTKEEAPSPNIIYILADDLGYGELGSYGQNLIATPHLDALAANGMRFTQHYSGSPVCAPSRCVLLTGQHTGNAYIRGNDEWAARGEVWNFAKAVEDPNLEGQRPLPDSIPTIAHLLKQKGYATGMVGKWGLGAPLTDGVPNNRGFDFFYGYNCQRQAHTLYPKHLWKNKEKVWLDNDLIAPHQALDSLADPNDAATYAKFFQKDFAPALMHEGALGFLEENKGNPFFLYYASPLPHLPLQVPQEYIDQYKGKFDEEAYIGNKGYFPAQYPRATYAAMITYLDQQVGELVQKLKDLGQYENTLIIFSSDNGPTYTGGADTEFFDSAKPFKTSYGWGKGFTHEGGIRVPMIASWPGKIATASESEHISAFWDVLPTLAEVAGTELPKHYDGISFLPTLLGKSQTQEHEYLYWEFPAYQGQQAVRMGKWKAIRKNIFKGNMDIELFNLETDPQEQYNLAEQEVEIVAKMEQIMKDAHTEAEIPRFKIKELGDQK